MWRVFQRRVCIFQVSAFFSTSLLLCQILCISSPSTYTPGFSDRLPWSISSLPRKTLEFDSRLPKVLKITSRLTSAPRSLTDYNHIRMYILWSRDYPAVSDNDLAYVGYILNISIRSSNFQSYISRKWKRKSDLLPLVASFSQSKLNLAVGS